ncbi:MAG TPA: RnfABCDGE type electron transport complex subunit B [Steroidobacteraceae bacterium]|jgi:electron transport complex protein RnfB|nr:RnfABCDGE type electron transport complex subunit B [Steroidobacteraceae bacterium]
MKTNASADSIDDLLPQTQCTRCGYSGCRPYAEAIAQGEANINQCPPGGTETMLALADLTGRDPLPLNGANGVEAAPAVAFIDEARCIGCTRCLPPCPVDAIVGAPRLMHTVLVELCTGCELCIAPCPVDCIVMMPLLASPAHAALSLPPPAASRARYRAHQARTALRAAEKSTLLADKKRGARAP